MTIGTALIISLLAIVALVAELVLYMLLGVGAALAGGAGFSALAVFFVGLMALTLAVAVLAPVGAVVELLAKRPNVGAWIVVVGAALAGVGYASMAARTWPAELTPATTPLALGATAPETRANAEARAYLEQHVTLENVQVKNGVRFGQTERGVFGTIVNHGDRTLSRVKVRVYFLDADGRRIGEKEYEPVAVTTFDLAPPLRPNYRKDFGFTAVDAPSGWNQRVEAEIVAIEFE